MPVQNKKNHNQNGNEKRLRLLIENTPAAIAIFDRKMRYLYVSKRWMQDYHLGSRNIIGLGHYEVFPEMPQHWKEIHRCSLSGETFSQDEESFTRADGTIEWVKWETCPWYGDDDKIGGIILFTEVITKRKKAEEALLKMNELLEKMVRDRTAELDAALKKEKSLNDLKSRFVSTASHEFRTPLSTLSSSLTLLEQYVKPAQESKEAKHFRRMKVSIHQLIEILDDFLSLDTLENGKAHLRYSGFNLKGLIQTCVDDMSLTVKRGQKIGLNYLGIEEVTQDPKALRLIVYNLLSNASKFSPEHAPIRLYINAGKTGINIQVKDKGIGIPENEHHLMFTRLFRAANATNVPGTGLGLNIIYSYIELMNGKISFESKPGEGTVFHVILPLPVHQ